MEICLKNTSIKIRPIDPSEHAQWEKLMDEHHYLGFNGVFGERIQYVAIDAEGNWLALLCWSCASLRCEARDKWIGWTFFERSQRLHFVVNNSRFLILSKGFRNLASHVLSLNLARLSLDWVKKYKHPIFLVETFVDPKNYQGTCYKAQGWVDVGMTKGFGKTQKGYIFHGEYKKVFLKPILPEARAILGSPFPNWQTLSLWPTKIRRIKTMNIGVLPIFGANGLWILLDQVKDHRSLHGRLHRTKGLLAICILATLSGCKSYREIEEWSKALSIKWLDKFLLRSSPSDSTIRRFLMGLDAEAIDKLITTWLLKYESLFGKALAIDGKTLRGSYGDGQKAVQLLSVVVHQEGTVLAQKKISDKTNEIPVAQALLQELNINGTVITLDALGTQTKTADVIVKGGADYVMTVKDNQEKLKLEIKKALAPTSAFSPSATGLFSN